MTFFQIAQNSPGGMFFTSSHDGILTIHDSYVFANSFEQNHKAPAAFAFVS